MANQDIFFQALGRKVRELRKSKSFSQEDMIAFGFSARHWQQVEAGRPITLTTLLRICEIFGTTVSAFAQGLDDGVYETPSFDLAPRKRRFTPRPSKP